MADTTKALTANKVTIKFDSETIKAVDVGLQLTWDDSCSFVRACVGSKGSETYSVKKGSRVEVSDYLWFIIAVDPDGNNEATLKKLREALKTKQGDSTEDYFKDVVIQIDESDGTAISTVSFTGFVFSMAEEEPDETNIRKYKCLIKIGDSSTLTIA